MNVTPPWFSKALREAQYHFVYQADCCYQGGGSQLFSTVSAAENQSACEALCSREPHCTAISRREKLCVLCATCKLRPQSGHFLSWSRAQLPPLLGMLGPLLQTDYSVKLYGSQNRVDVLRLQLVWVSLLPDAAKQLIARSGGVCKYDSGQPWRPFFAALDIFANPLDAVWLSWEHASSSLAFPVANDTWVEVTHCAQGKHAVGKRGYGWQFGPMWLYAAPGSGVSMNVGRTVAMSFPDAARLLRRVYPSSLECACEPGCEFGLKSGTALPKNGSSCIRHFIPNASPSNTPFVNRIRRGEGSPGHDGMGPEWPTTQNAFAHYMRCWTREEALAEIDTIQIVNHVEYFSREKRHEIVRLRQSGECASLTESTPDLLCGRHPHLTSCGPNSSALQRVNRCVLSKTPISSGLAAAINFTGRRCQMTNDF